MNTVKTVSEIKQIVVNNTSMSTGMFHCDTLDEVSLVHDIQNKFILDKTSSCNTDEEDLLYDIIKKSTKKISGRINGRELKIKVFIKKLTESFNIQPK